MNRDVKQDDQDKTLCFNAVLDELVAELEKLPGVKIGNNKVACLAHAYDLVLIAKDVDGNSLR